MKNFILKYKKLLIPIIILIVLAISLVIFIVFNYLPIFYSKNNFENDVLAFANKNSKSVC